MFAQVLDLLLLFEIVPFHLFLVILLLFELLLLLFDIFLVQLFLIITLLFELLL